MEAARQRLCAVIEMREQTIVASRAAESKWPPAEGSAEARVRALAQGGEHFETCRKIKASREWTHYKNTTASAFLAKLKDLSLSIQEGEEHAQVSYKGKGICLRPGDVLP